MNNKIKEILDFKEDADYKKLSIEDILLLKEYITNLQEENKKLKKLQEENDKFCDETMKDMKDNLIARINRQEKEIEELKAKLEMYENGVYFSSENDELQQRIDKAIEYIENNTLYSEDYDYDYEDNLQFQGAYDYKAREDLLNILKGSDKEC